MQRVTIASTNSTTTLVKFVLRSFIDCPQTNRTTLYMEICAKANQAFVLILPNSANLSLKHDFCDDHRTLSKLITGYKILDPATGKCQQLVGETELNVTPQEARITQVSTPAEHPVGAKAFNVVFPPLGDLENILGTWLKAEFPSTNRVIGRANARLKFSFCSENVHIKHLYLFWMLPQNYEDAKSVCFKESDNTLTVGEPMSCTVHAYELPPTHPVFHEWLTLIYSRLILRTDKYITLAPGERTILDLKVRSENLSSKLVVQAYLSGICFALSTNIFTSAVFYLQDEGMTNLVMFELLISAILSFISGLFGYRAITQ